MKRAIILHNSPPLASTGCLVVAITEPCLCRTWAPRMNECMNGMERPEIGGLIPRTRVQSSHDPQCLMCSMTHSAGCDEWSFSCNFMWLDPHPR